MSLEPVEETLPDRTWLRVADEAWEDPLDPSWAAKHGGRWNPPQSFPTLYLSEDLETARAQIDRLLAGQPVEPEDLDPPFVLVAATLPRRQRVANAVSDTGLAGLGLPTSYPLDPLGREITHATCQPIGAAVHDGGLHGVHCRSAATPSGRGRELAWYPLRRTSRARPVGRAQRFCDWWPR